MAVQAFLGPPAGLRTTRTAKRSRVCTTVCIDRRDALFSAVAATGLAFLRLEPLSAKTLEGSPQLRGLEDENKRDLPPFESSSIDGRVKVQEVLTGSGAAVGDGWRLSVNYVIRRSNGYFVDASYGFDRFETYSFTVGSGAVIPGFEIGVSGMQVGGRRRFAVPPALGYVAGGTEKSSPGPIPPDWGNRRSLKTHSNEPLLFEVALVRATPPRGGSAPGVE